MSFITYIPAGDQFPSDVVVPISRELIRQTITPLKDLKEIFQTNFNRQLGEHYTYAGTSKVIEKWEQCRMQRAYSSLSALALFQPAWNQLQTAGYCTFPYFEVLERCSRRWSYRVRSASASSAWIGGKTVKEATPGCPDIGGSAAPQLTEDAGNAQMSVMGTVACRDTSKADSPPDLYYRYSWTRSQPAGRPCMQPCRSQD
jgi:hypothetical protein